MTSELRPAVEVFRNAVDATGAFVRFKRKSEQAAAAVIEADREAVRAEQAAELAKYKALAETLAGALERVAQGDMPDFDENGNRLWFNGGEGFSEWVQSFAAAVVASYKEQRDA